MEGALRRREVDALASEVSLLLDLEISEVNDLARVTERLMDLGIYLSIARKNLDPKDWVVTVQANASHGVGRHSRLMPALWIAIILWVEANK